MAWASKESAVGRLSTTHMPGPMGGSDMQYHYNHMAEEDKIPLDASWRYVLLR